MTTSPPPIEETNSATPVVEDALPDATALEDKMPEWFRTTWPATLFTFVCGLFFVIYNVLAIYHTDIWSHISYGEIIWTAKSIPETEPLMPLSSGVRFVDTAWLSQILLYQLHNWQGVAGLQFFHGGCITLSVGLLVWLIYSRSRNVPMTIIGVVLLYWIQRLQFAIIRPQLAGLVCFTILFVLLNARRWTRWHLAAVSLLFVCWANLHGSFVVGLALIAACCAGSGIDLLRRTDKISAIFMGKKFRRFLAVLELGILGTLLNPYGLAIYGNVLTFSSNPNLADILDWGTSNYPHRTRTGRRVYCPHASACIPNDPATHFLQRSFPTRRVGNSHSLDIAIHRLVGASCSLLLCVTWQCHLETFSQRESGE